MLPARMTHLGWEPRLPPSLGHVSASTQEHTYPGSPAELRAHGIWNTKHRQAARSDSQLSPGHQICFWTQPRPLLQAALLAKRWGSRCLLPRCPISAFSTQRLMSLKRSRAGLCPAEPPRACTRAVLNPPPHHPFPGWARRQWRQFVTAEGGTGASAALCRCPPPEQPRPARPGPAAMCGDNARRARPAAGGTRPAGRGRGGGRAGRGAGGTLSAPAPLPLPRAGLVPAPQRRGPGPGPAAPSPRWAVARRLRAAPGPWCPAGPRWCRWGPWRGQGGGQGPGPRRAHMDPPPPAAAGAKGRESAKSPDRAAPAADGSDAPSAADGSGTLSATWPAPPRGAPGYAVRRARRRRDVAGHRYRGDAGQAVSARTSRLRSRGPARTAPSREPRSGTGRSEPNRTNSSAAPTLWGIRCFSEKPSRIRAPFSERLVWLSEEGGVRGYMGLLCHGHGALPCWL